MEVTVEKRIVSQISDSLRVAVYDTDGKCTIRVHTWHSCVYMTLAEWREINSAIALALDKLGGAY